MSDIHYASYTISVSLDMQSDRPLTLLDTPYIPAYTMAIISWVKSPNSDPFDFHQFMWCPPGKPLSIPLIRDEAIVTLFSNLQESDRGRWHYQLSVRPKVQSDAPIWTGQCLHDSPQPEGNLYTLRLADTGPMIVNTGA